MNLKHLIPLCLALSALSSCISPQDEASDCNDCNEQQIILHVEENSGATTRSGRPLYSSEHNQMVDHVALFICYYGNNEADKPDNQIVAVQHITDWEQESTEYDNGRRYYLNLMGNNRVPEGEATYKIYAIGYTQRKSNTSAYTYDGKFLHDYLTGLTAGKTFPENLTLSLSLSSTPGEEIFAGINTETDGLIHSNEAGGFTTQVVLHRQVAGVYMYVKDIPQRNQATELRLTAFCDNDGLVLGEFDTEDYAQNTKKGKYVVNGTTLDINGESRATLCSIRLQEWKDDNGQWQNPYDESNRHPAFQVNSYYAGCFVIPFAAPSETGTTLQMELYGADTTPLQTWKVKLPDEDTQVKGFLRYEWKDGKFVSDNVTETQEAYSLLRNHLYCIGRKDKDGDTTDDQPISLGDSNEIILKVIAEWDIIYDMQLEPKPTKQGQ